MLKSVSQALSGLGKLRLGSLTASLGSAAALIGVHAPTSLKESLAVAAGAVLGAVNVGDSIIRAAHLSALPALVEKEAANVKEDVGNPKVDAVAEKVETIAARVSGLENRPNAPTLSEIIAGLTGKSEDAPVAAPAPVSAAAPAEATPSPASASVDPLAPVQTPSA